MGAPTETQGRAPRVPAFGIRATPEWRGWASRLAESEDVNFSDLVARALKVYAKQVGFPEPAPKR
jgi:hypothetical protein